MANKVRNKEAAYRARIARFLWKSLKELNITPTQVANATGLDLQTIMRLQKAAPHSRVLSQLQEYVQKEARIIGAKYNYKLGSKSAIGTKTPSTRLQMNRTSG
jgi:hypothetical protein